MLQHLCNILYDFEAIKVRSQLCQTGGDVLRQMVVGFSGL